MLSLRGKEAKANHQSYLLGRRQGPIDRMTTVRSNAEGTRCKGSRYCRHASQWEGCRKTGPVERGDATAVHAAQHIVRGRQSTDTAPA